MISNNNQDGKPFAPPAHLFSDPIALSEFLEENFPDEMETVSVTDDNIATMEDAAGFLMPEEYVVHWLDKGSQFFGKDDFVFTLYCYNNEGPNGNDLYSFLTFWQNFKGRSFDLLCMFMLLKNMGSSPNGRSLLNNMTATAGAEAPM